MWEQNLSYNYPKIGYSPTPTVESTPNNQKQSFLQNEAQNAKEWQMSDMSDMRKYSYQKANNFYASGLNYSNEMISRFKRLEKYAIGQQDMSHYLKNIGYDPDENVDKVSASLRAKKLASLGLGEGGNPDLLRFKLVPTLIEAVIGRIVPLKREVVITAYDKTAKEQRMNAVNQIKAANYLKQSLPPETLQYGDTSPMQEPIEQPLPIESLLTEAVNCVVDYTAEGFRAVEKQTSKTTIAQGVGALKVEVTANNFISYRRCDITRLFVEMPIKQDFSDIDAIGEMITLTISDLIQLDKENFYTFEDWCSVPATYGRIWILDKGLQYHTRCDVLDCEWLDKDPADNMIYVYKAKFVIGTNIVLDFGKNPFQVRGELVKGQFYNTSNFSFIINSPYIGLFGGIIDSLLQRAEADIKSYEICRINFFAEVLNAYPTTHVVNESTIEMIHEMFTKIVDTTGSQGKAGVNAIQIAYEMLAAGQLIMPDPRYDPKTMQIIKPEPPYRIPGGLTEAAAGWIMQARQFKQDIKETMGIPDGIAPSLPNDNTSVNAQRSAMGSSESVLSAISDSNEILYTKLCRHIAMLIPQLASRYLDGDIEYTELSNLFSEKEMQQLADIETIYNHALNFKVKASPVMEQYAKFDEALARAVEAGTITSTEAIEFSRNAKNNFEDALRELKEAEKTHENAQREHEIEIQRANADGNAKAAEIAQTAQINNTIQEGKNEIDKISKQWEIDQQKIKLEFEYAYKLEQLKLKHKPKPKTKNGN